MKVFNVRSGPKDSNGDANWIARGLISRERAEAVAAAAVARGKTDVIIDTGDQPDDEESPRPGFAETPAGRR